MKLKLLTLACHPESGSFPEDPLTDLEGEILNIAEHFYYDHGQPRLLLLVHYRPYRDAQRGRGPQHSGVRTELSEPEQAVFDRLRAWRNARASAEGVPPYALFNNRQVAEIARRRPNSLSALCQIDGIGDQKAGRYGREILAVLQAPQAGAAPPAPPERPAQPGGGPG